MLIPGGHTGTNYRNLCRIAMQKANISMRGGGHLRHLPTEGTFSNHDELFSRRWTRSGPRMDQYWTCLILPAKEPRDILDIGISYAMP